MLCEDQRTSVPVHWLILLPRKDTERYQCLQSALATHNLVTRRAATGHGIDRHLLGLRLQMHAGENSCLLSDELFRLSQEWKLSTSGLSAGDRFMGTGSVHVHINGGDGLLQIH